MGWKERKRKQVREKIQPFLNGNKATRAAFSDEKRDAAPEDNNKKKEKTLWNN